MNEKYTLQIVVDSQTNGLLLEALAAYSDKVKEEDREAYDDMRDTLSQCDLWFYAKEHPELDEEDE